MKKESIPKLRFPGFVTEWKERKLGSIASKIGSGKTPLGGEAVYVKEGISFIRSQNVIDNNLKLDGTNIPISIHYEMSGSKVLPKDILLNITGGSIGRSCVVPENFSEGNVNQHVCIIRLENDNPYFLQPILSSYKGQKLILQAQTGSGREGLNFESIKGFKIYFPEPAEQTKIASFLTAVDKRITLLTQKKEKLEQYKKGIMQKIFNREIRFRDELGKEFPEWEEKRLGELYEFKPTNSLSRENLNYENGIVKNIHYGDIHTKFRSSFRVEEEYVPYINPNIDISKIPSDNYLEEGDLVIADASEDYDDIGKAIEILSLNGEKVVAGLHTILARRKNNDVSIGFLGYLMKSENFRLKVKRIAQGTKVLSISSGRLVQIDILLPSISEQQKIASFLSALEKQIVAVYEQVDKMKQWKKGLLQKMFV